MFKNRLLIVLFFMCFSSYALASDRENLPYPCLKDGAKITVSAGDNWTSKINKKSLYFVKAASEFYSKDNTTGFDTGCSYIFINKGRLIGYSSDDLKFYEFEMKDNVVNRRELLSDEVQILFKDFRVIKITEFSTTTNVFKFKKKRANEKIMILNDTDRNFSNYSFTTNNSKFDVYNINNVIGITKRGMIQFSRFGENSKNSPWFILLVR